MARPKFWLQVRKDYIFDNFDNLVNYVRQYSYNPHDDNPDYDSTLKEMLALSDEIGAAVKATPFYKEPDLSGYSVEQVLRLFMATILTSNKTRVTPYSVILSLAELLVRIKGDLDEDCIRGIFNIVLNCLRRNELSAAGFTWNDVTEEKVNIRMTAINFSKMTFRDTRADAPWHYVENKGLLLLPPSGALEMSVANRMRYSSMAREVQYELQGLVKIIVEAKDMEKTADFDRLYKMTSRLLAAQDQMRPSPKMSLKTYGKDESFPVRIVSKRGNLVVAETVDPTYSPLSGKVFLATRPDRPVMNDFVENLEVGDYILVDISEDPAYAFDILDSFEDFYRDCACRCAGEKRLAVFQNTYPSGTSWVTEDGIRIGIDKKKIDDLDDGNREIIEEAIRLKSPIEIKFYDRPPRADRDTFNVYAEPVPEAWEPGEEDWFNIDDANSEIILAFVEEAARMANECGGDVERRDYVAGNPVEFASMIPVLYRFITAGLSSCRLRLEYATAVAMMCRILDRSCEYAFMEHERKYLYSQVQFAANREIAHITHTACLEDVEEVRRREEIISTLASYKKKKPTEKGNAIVGDMSGDDVIRKVDALISASNNLIGIIDTIELNNIKQAIARALSIEDEYVSILDDRTFYGMESISLEFKTSVVFPPANRRRLASAVADPEMQKWAIIKAVCGFLNSRSGGELLIGVNDAGYAMGLEDDMRKLFELRQISAPDLDHYRTYLQSIMDRAFREIGGKAVPQDISRPNIEYLPEVNAEGKTIMRIKIRPHKGYVVALAAPAGERPRGIEDSYVRLSGRTVVVTPSMREEIQTYK